MIWKEQFHKDIWYILNDDNEECIISFIETQIIEKLIEEIPDWLNVDDPNHEVLNLKQHLKAKWLKD